MRHRHSQLPPTHTTPLIREVQRTSAIIELNRILEVREAVRTTVCGTGDDKSVWGVECAEPHSTQNGPVAAVPHAEQNLGVRVRIGGWPALSMETLLRSDSIVALQRTFDSEALLGRLARTAGPKQGWTTRGPRRPALDPDRTPSTPIVGACGRPRCRPHRYRCRSRCLGPHCSCLVASAKETRWSPQHYARSISVPLVGSDVVHRSVSR